MGIEAPIFRVFRFFLFSEYQKLGTFLKHLLQERSLDMRLHTAKEAHSAELAVCL